VLSPNAESVVMLGSSFWGGADGALRPGCLRSALDVVVDLREVGRSLVYNMNQTAGSSRGAFFQEGTPWWSPQSAGTHPYPVMRGVRTKTGRSGKGRWPRVKGRRKVGCGKGENGWKAYSKSKGGSLRTSMKNHPSRRQSARVRKGGGPLAVATPAIHLVWI